MSIKEKMDVLDFIINILREHERALSDLIRRFENTSQDLEYLTKSVRYHPLSIRTREILTEMLGEPISFSGS